MPPKTAAGVATLGLRFKEDLGTWPLIARQSSLETTGGIIQTVDTVACGDRR